MLSDDYSRVQDQNVRDSMRAAKAVSALAADGGSHQHASTSRDPCMSTINVLSDDDSRAYDQHIRRRTSGVGSDIERAPSEHSISWYSRTPPTRGRMESAPVERCISLCTHTPLSTPHN